MFYYILSFVCSVHPYIFFNQDGMSLTFVGFMVSPDGNLIDAKRAVLEHSVMSKRLKVVLKNQGVDFEDNYQTWSKDKMVHKIARVMGLSNANDPDKSYVLTPDNLIKILAIQMRFRQVYCTPFFVYRFEYTPCLCINIGVIFLLC